jgi:F-type H+-transporting ATPase subunit b
MDSLIETFHIDYRLLIAQAVNFAIVFAVLYFFAVKPILKVMRERTSKIEKSLEDAKKIDEKLANTEAEYKKMIAEAKKDAEQILEKAQGQAEERKKATVQKAKEEIGVIINKEKEQMRLEKAQTLKEIKQETMDLVVASLEKILEEKMDGKKDKELIEKILKK